MSAVGSTLDQAAAAIDAAPSLALACHHTPDGDALGSMLALHHLALAAGKQSVASWPEPFDVAAHYDFLPGLDLTTKPADFPRAPDLMVTFDCGSIDRLAELGEPARNAHQLIVVDHHSTNDGYGTINLIDPGATRPWWSADCSTAWDGIWARSPVPLHRPVCDTDRFQPEHHPRRVHPGPSCPPSICPSRR
ncbi:MAG: DHH family phosphoesterase [Acidimicrobiales bacterium]